MPLDLPAPSQLGEDAFADVAGALELAEHDQSLFPMLSDTSLGCIDVEEPEPAQRLQNAGATTSAEDPFETQDLSPILAPIAMPLEFEAKDDAEDLAPEPSTPVVLRRHSGGVDRIVLRNSPGMRQALMELAEAHANRVNTPILSTRKSPRRKAAAASSSAAPLRRKQKEALSPLKTWTEHEQNNFFSMFKGKWPPGTDGQGQTAFGSLLLQRFDQISKKIKTKSVIEVRQFYNAVIRNVTELLRDVTNDIDLTNPDETRITVWCWSKLLASERTTLDRVQTIDDMDEKNRNRIAHSLHQSIVRSRRQMLKAKSTELVHGSSHRAALSTISTWMNRSSTNAFLAGKSTYSMDETIVHHPVVRKKNGAPSPSTPVLEAIMSGRVSGLSRTPIQIAGPKRSRDDSATHSTPVPKKRRTHVVGTEPDFMSPPQAVISGRGAASKREIAFQTPQELSRKKIYIKMRMVPKNSQTKQWVTTTGSRHKVELKLSSTKKMSDVAKHMESKWAKVHSSVPSGSVLHFFQKGHDFSTDGTHGWTEMSEDVTCLEIWKLCGREINGENVVEVSYGWFPASASSIQRTDSKLSKLARSSGDLFGKLMSSQEGQAGSTTVSETVSPTRGLQAFGEQMAFERDASDNEILSLGGDQSDAFSESSPLGGRPRQRIIPMLVAHEEFNV